MAQLTPMPSTPTSVPELRELPPSPTKAIASPLSFPLGLIPPFVKQHGAKLTNAAYRRVANGRKDPVPAIDAQRTQWSQTSDTSGTITPPPPYADIVLPQPQMYATADVLLSQDPAAGTPGSVENAHMSVTPAAQPIAIKRTLSGINRKYSRQGMSELRARVHRPNLYFTGLNLLAASAQEAAARSASPTPPGLSSATPFSRQLYIHSLTYLLRGLPDTLTNDEIVSLRTALPASLDPAGATPASMSSGRDHDGRSSYFPLTNNCYSDPSTSYLHRMVSAATVKIFLLISLLVPYIQAGISWLYCFERENHISERVFSGTVYTADMLGKRAVSLTATIWGLNEGKVGAVVQDAAFWLIRGVTGGLCQGVGQGMDMLAPAAGRAMRQEPGTPGPSPGVGSVPVSPWRR